MVTALTVLSATPVFFVRPSAALLIGVLLSVIIGVAVIALLLRRDVRALLRA